MRRPDRRLAVLLALGASPFAMLPAIQPATHSSRPAAARSDRMQDGSRPIVGEHDAHTLVFRPHAEATPQLRAAVRELAGAIGEREIWRGMLFRLELPPGADLRSTLVRLNGSGLVRYAEPNFIARACGTPNDPLFSQQWQMDQASDADMDMVEAWDIAQGSPGVTLAVIDSGFDYVHPDLANKAWINPNEIAANGIDDDSNGWIDDVHGIDAFNIDGDPMDDLGHGTFVTGVAAAEPDNGIGMAGVAWQAKAMGLKFLSSSGSGNLADAIICLDYAVTNGARVSNHSYATSSYSQSLYDAFDAAGDAGHLAIVPGSNSAKNIDVSPVYPVCFDLPEILAITGSDETDALCGFADFGKVSIDVLVPGNNIQSTTLGGGWSVGSANSYAAPTATGLAALLASASGSTDGQVIKDWILDSVDPFASLNLKCATGGRINAWRAARYATLSNLADPLWTYDGPRMSATVGRAMAIHPDLDGDSITELAIGAPGDKPGTTTSGSVRVVSGRTGAELRTIAPVNQALAAFGAALTALDDVDSDGIADLVVGVPDLNANSATDAGGWRIVSGATGAVIRSANGSVNSGHLGSALCATGDLDGDGSPDFAVGASGESRVTARRAIDGGQLWTIARAAADEFGAALANAGDQNGDGLDDVLVGIPGTASAEVLSGADGSTITTLNYGTADRVGATVANVGDVDRDGADDLAVANDARARVLRVVSGATGALLYRLNFPAGNVGELAAIAATGDRDHDKNPDYWIAWEGADVAELRSGADGSLLQVIRSTPGDAFGSGLLADADLNGDGAFDLAVGAQLADPAVGPDAGTVAAFHSHEFRLEITPSDPFEGDSVTANVSGGETTALWMLVLVDVDGVPLFLPLLTDALDEFGSYELSDDVPTGLSGSTFTLIAYTLKYAGPRLVVSNAVVVAVQ
ncbi:MAG: hypothetical protein EXS13_08725 [Planctomycetes bacterium]|nr:hypothetical protein [Planctomycetota bacterium]